MGRVQLDIDGQVATLTIDNAERRNAMSEAMWRELATRLVELAAAADVRAVIVRGAGEAAFCAGADIADFETARTGPVNAQVYDDLVETTCQALEAVRCPTVALIHGSCMGAGLSVAASCDLRLVSSGAQFALPAAKLGLGYDPRGVQRFLRVFGGPATTILALSGERVGAPRAFELGIASFAGEKTAMEDMAQRLVGQIAKMAPLTLAASKAALKAGRMSEPDAWNDAMRLYAAADASEDYQEGRRAFREKREPRFQGR